MSGNPCSAHIFILFSIATSIAYIAKKLKTWHGKSTFYFRFNQNMFAALSMGSTITPSTLFFLKNELGGCDFVRSKTPKPMAKD